MSHDHTSSHFVITILPLFLKLSFYPFLENYYFALYLFQITFFIHHIIHNISSPCIILFLSRFMHHSTFTLSCKNYHFTSVISNHYFHASFYFMSCIIAMHHHLFWACIILILPMYMHNYHFAPSHAFHHNSSFSIKDKD